MSISGNTIIWEGGSKDGGYAFPVGNIQNNSRLYAKISFQAGDASSLAMSLYDNVSGTDLAYSFLGTNTTDDNKEITIDLSAITCLTGEVGIVFHGQSGAGGQANYVQIHELYIE